MKIFLLPAITFLRAIVLMAVWAAVGLLTTPALAQKPLHVTHGCAYKTATEDTDLYTFEPSVEADRIVSEICNVVGLSQNFDIRAANVENAMAVNEGSRRIILYSNLFLKKFNEDARTRWAAYSVLAHEIGHHLNNHDFGEPNPGKRKTMELEADRFSGSALRQLGASLDEAKAGIETFALQGEQAKHPSAKARLEALATGWNQQQERLEKMGAGIPTSDSNIPRERDTDGDGIPDRNDACPDEYGRSLTAGCPDADEDGIPDSEDKCRYLKGLAQWKGCPDSDGDGLPDHEDRCPKEPGQLADSGCPPPDKDGDSVIDRVDKCPDVYGLARYQGCPDTDGDEVPDNVDKCPKEKGEPLYDGCASPKIVGGSKSEGDMANNMVFVKGGTFQMGSNDGESDERPVHNVHINDFYISKYEVTQAEWIKIMGNNPSQFKNCDNCPVEFVSWNEVQEFLQKFNKLYSDKNYRLPTEAEWEFAARGGNLSKGFIYAGSNKLEEVAWFDANSENKTHEVGTRKANELGIFDMIGNVWELCEDDYHENFNSAPIDGKQWIDGPRGATRVRRGSGWIYGKNFCSITERLDWTPENKNGAHGFRLAASVR